MYIDTGTFFHLLFGQSNMQPFRRPVGVGNRDRRDQDFPAAQPAARVDYEIPDAPTLIVEIELFDGPQFAVQGLNRQAL